MIELGDVVPTLLAVGLLMALTVAALAAFGAPHRFSPAVAIFRGAAQLAMISLILGGVIAQPVWAAAALLLMFTVASVTAAHRIGWNWTRLALVGASMAGGVTAALVIVFATGAIAFDPRYALAVGGIVIGNTMTIAALAGRRFHETVNERWEEVEGWLALGASRRQSTLNLARGAVYASLIPSTDQTKTTGLVTLPGAFVGAIFGGASPLEAGRFQLVVLASIMAAGSITAVMLIGFLAPVRRRPAHLG